MSQDCYDVIIIGGGPAGCAAALSLPPGTRGLLVDRARSGAQRCCGGLLTEEAHAALASLRLRVPDEVRVQPEPQFVHAHDLDSGREQRYHRPYLNLDRDRFDEWLLDLAAARVDVYRETRFVGRDTQNGEILLRRRDKTETVRARLLVGADGANSTVRRLCLPQLPHLRSMIALQALLPRLDGLDPRSDAHEVLFGRELTDFYAWGIPKGEHMVVGCAFDESACTRERFERVLGWYRDHQGLGDEVLGRSARRLSLPRTPRELSAGDADVLLTGEAAGLVSPSSGEGISFALLSGAAAGRAVSAATPHREYRRAFRPLALKIVAKLPKAAVIYSPRLRSLALRCPWAP